MRKKQNRDMIVENCSTALLVHKSTGYLFKDKANWILFIQFFVLASHFFIFVPDLSARVDAVKEENLKLKSENQVLGQYIENLMSASSVFQTTDTKSKRK